MGQRKVVLVMSTAQARGVITPMTMRSADIPERVTDSICNG